VEEAGVGELLDPGVHEGAAEEEAERKQRGAGPKAIAHTTDYRRRS
jgi:hypothetical protein